MSRPLWTLAVAALLMVIVWAFALRDGLDLFSAAAAVVVSIGVVLFARDTLRARRRARDDGPPPPEPPRSGPTRV